MPTRVMCSAATSFPYAAGVRPRAVKMMAVFVALLTPDAVEGLVQLAKAVLTDERLTRWGAQSWVIPGCTCTVCVERCA